MTDTDQEETEGEAEGESVAETFFKDSGPGREEMASDYLPEGEDWLAKTLLDVNDPAAIAALSNLEEIYPEVEDLQPLVDGVLNNFLRGKTSVGGMSRSEYEGILKSMYGGTNEDGENTAMKLVAPEQD